MTGYGIRQCCCGDTADQYYGDSYYYYDTEDLVNPCTHDLCSASEGVPVKFYGTKIVGASEEVVEFNFYGTLPNVFGAETSVWRGQETSKIGSDVYNIVHCRNYVRGGTTNFSSLQVSEYDFDLGESVANSSQGQWYHEDDPATLHALQGRLFCDPFLGEKTCMVFFGVCNPSISWELSL